MFAIWLRVHHIKDDLFTPPPLFKEIKRVSGTSDREMHQVYNMGHRFEVFCEPRATDEIIEISKSFNIDARIIGRTEKAKESNNKNHLSIFTENSQLSYG